MKKRLGKRLASWNRYLALTGSILILAGLAMVLIYGWRLLAGEVVLAFGLLFLLAAWWVKPEAVRSALAGRAVHYGTNLALMGLALIGTAVLLNILSHRHYGRWDLTEDKLHSLSPQTRRVLDRVEQPVQVTGFFYQDQRNDELDAIDRLEAYAAYNRLISYRTVDPEVQRSLAEQYGITNPNYTLVFESAGKRHDVTSTDEQAFTSAILRVSQDRLVTVYFLQGHNERDIGNRDQDGYSDVADLLDQAGYGVETLNLTTRSDTLPVSDTLILLAGPQFPLLEMEVQLLADYLGRGGKLLTLLDPLVSPDLSEVLDPWGLSVKDSLIVDPTNALAGVDPTIPLHYYAKQDHPITEDLPATFYPGARPVDMAMPTERPAGLTIVPLLGTSDASWAESNPDEQPMALDPEEDEQGPLFLAIALQGRLDRDQTFETRIVVVGDSDFAVNGYAGGNYQFFLNTINWLAEGVVIEIGPVEVPPRPLLLNPVQARAVRYSTMVGLPLLVLGIGLGVWLQRRKK